MAGEVRYCTTEDGVRIAYSIAGEGPLLLLCPIFVESFSLDDSVPEFAEFVQKLGQGRTLVRFDGRGTGLSDRNPGDLSHEAQVLDLDAVITSESLEALVIMAPTSSGPCAIDFTARHPDVVAGLILYGTAVGGRNVMPLETWQGLILMSKTSWPLVARTLSDLAGREEYPETLTRYADWFIMSADGETAGQILEARVEVDVTDLLPQIRCPTLVLHRQKDPLFPFSAGQMLAAGIPGARLVPLPGAGHNPALGEPEPILRAIDGFLSQVAPHEGGRARETASGGGKDVRAILFTDLVGHTAMMQRLGDDRGRDVLREHERMTREVLKQSGGTEVKTLGDGFMASFSSVTEGVKCAIALQRSFADRNQSADEPLEIRVGLNVGEPIEEEGDLFGTTVIVAARIAAKAEGGQILASLAVRELCAGKRFPFADLGDHVLRGVEDEVRIFEVSWRE